MNIVLSRKYGDKETTSTLYIFDSDQILFTCDALELPNLGNKQDVSCIPEGVYEVHKVTVPKLGNCFELQNVPNRTGILIHAGNYAAGNKVDTRGCILVGNALMDINGDGISDIINSIVTLTKLTSILPDNFNIYILS